MNSLWSIEIYKVGDYEKGFWCRETRNVKTHSLIECRCGEKLPTGIFRSLLLSGCLDHSLGGTVFQ
jgi:hypothetical protein